mmetsp:Transcript_14683/g.32425  ORF Transcript_14683/g.32425 Transcript_14683/m.32425 type:complete len:340 (-) Transcript_14683:469-1488(-)
MRTLSVGMIEPQVCHAAGLINFRLIKKGTDTSLSGSSCNFRRPARPYSHDETNLHRLQPRPPRPCCSRCTPNALPREKDRKPRVPPAADELQARVFATRPVLTVLGIPRGARSGVVAILPVTGAPSGRGRGRLQNLEGAHEGVVHRHDRAGVVELSAVVGGGEERHELASREEFVAVFDHLMGADEEVQVVAAEELGDHVAAEGEGDAPVVFAPAGDGRVGIRPDEIAQETHVGHVARPGDVGQLLQLVELGGESSVDADDLVVDDGGAGQTVKDVAELLPHFDGVATATLVVETVDAANTGALVVSAQQEEILRIFHLVGEEKVGHLQRLFPAVHVVA